MGWQDDMKRDAARVAFPDLELDDGDRVEIAGNWNEAWGYSTYTFENAEFTFSVSVWRNNHPELGGSRCIRNHDYSNSEAQEFFVALMHAGSS